MHEWINNLNEDSMFGQITEYMLWTFLVCNVIAVNSDNNYHATELLMSNATIIIIGLK